MSDDPVARYRRPKINGQNGWYFETETQKVKLGVNSYVLDHGESIGTCPIDVRRPGGQISAAENKWPERTAFRNTDPKSQTRLLFKYIRPPGVDWYMSHRCPTTQWPDIVCRK